MKPRTISFNLSHTLLLISGISLCFLSPADAKELPHAATQEIDFLEDIRPLFAKHCLHCHREDRKKGKFSLESRDAFLKGGRSGKAVEVGKGKESLLVALIAELEPGELMPADVESGKGRRLNQEEISKVIAWIDQGAHWPVGVQVTSREKKLPVKPRLPEISKVSTGVNPIDHLLKPYFKNHDVDTRALVSDQRYVRRAYLDTIGLLPQPKNLEDYINDKSANKEEALVQGLLARDDDFTEHWLSYWNDALRNDYGGTGYIDGGRRQITSWLKKAISTNMPYDQFVRELIEPAPGAEGFIKGIVWRGVVNASQVPEVQAAQNISQVFLGINLKCASCHDSFINAWTLEEAYSFAALFTEKKLEIHRCNKPIGKVAKPQFLFPELGQVDPTGNRQQRLKQLAQVITSKNNGLLTRTFVNRLWAQFFGRGIVEPIDDMEQPAWNRDLLDWLAWDFAENGYDIKRTIQLILTSEAYRLPAVPGKEREEGEYIFKGPTVRRMDAEMFVDALSSLTGVWPKASGKNITQKLVKTNIKKKASTAHGDSLKYSSGVLKRGFREVEVDIKGSHTLWLVARQGPGGANHGWADWAEPHFVNKATNEVKKLTDLKWNTATTGHKKVLIDKNCVGNALRLEGYDPKYGLGTHVNSVISYSIPSGFTHFRVLVGPDREAIEASPDKGHEIEFLVFTDIKVSSRTSLFKKDPLTTALGRPSRDQVITRRESVATTLQALELTNGKTLASFLSQAAKTWLSRVDTKNPNSIVEEVYFRALGRAPKASEKDVASELLGQPVTQEGLEDLFWVVAMLPEFQLIY